MDMYNPSQESQGAFRGMLSLTVSDENVLRIAENVGPLRYCFIISHQTFLFTTKYFEIQYWCLHFGFEQKYDLVSIFIMLTNSYLSTFSLYIKH